MMERLQESPWLAKSVLIVSPLSKNISMHTAVEQFIGDFSSKSTSTMRKDTKWSRSKSRSKSTNSVNVSNSNSSMGMTMAMRNLPVSFKSNLIRQLIVLDIKESSGYEENQTISILPQGRSGALPNLDLISAVRFCLLKQMRQSNNIKIQMHPYDMTWWDSLVKTHLPKEKWWQNYGEDLGGMFAFMTASLVEMRSSQHTSTNSNGDDDGMDKNHLVLPHAPALKEGIDSITIRAVFHPNSDKRVTHRDIVATVQSVEHLIRGLSSLNERLHHSINQYTMPSGSTFVSHGEFILPAILLLLPLALRVISLILHHADAGAGTGTTEFRFHDALRCFACALVVSFTLFFLNINSTLSLSSLELHHQDSDSMKKCIGLIVYAAMFIYACCGTESFKKFWSGQHHHREEKRRRNDRRSLQCLACLLALYMQVPIVLSNISLAIPSAIIWVPVFSFFDYGVPTFFSYVMQNGTLVLSVFLLQLFSLRMSSLYICTVAAPLHFILAVLCWT